MTDKGVNREWSVQGRYEYYAVDEYRPDEKDNCTYGTVDTFRTRKQAQKVADALNRAFRQGMDFQRKLDES